jgi:1-deoxy-D-xylulose-5-phosphate reductoisomerase
MKKLTILGCTGSIGRNALQVVQQFPERFKVVALAAGRNIELLRSQIEQFRPQVAVLLDEGAALRLRREVAAKYAVEVLFGEEGYKTAASLPSVDLVFSAMVGAAGLLPTLAAVEQGKRVALANKESLVMAGQLLMETARDKHGTIIPVDSEHSAIFQSMLGHRKEDVTKIFLTASGGPFLDIPQERFHTISSEMALNHPTWTMGPKITIDSATLMNKGLEVIEAKWLFDMPLERIEVVIHPQSIVHSMVLYCDGSVMAQLGLPDMRTPIAFAMSYPQRLALPLPAPDFFEIARLTFKKPDLHKFRCLALAFDACRAGNTYPAVLNAANEIAVEAFLQHRIGLGKIAAIVENTMQKHQPVSDPTLSDILSADGWARQAAKVDI